MMTLYLPMVFQFNVQKFRSVKMDLIGKKNHKIHFSYDNLLEKNTFITKVRTVG